MTEGAFEGLVAVLHDVGSADEISIEVWSNIQRIDRCVIGTACTSEYDIFTIGAGYLDVEGALACTDVVSGTT